LRGALRPAKIAASTTGAITVRPFPLLALVALAACRPATNPPVDPGPEIRALLDQSARAWNAGDLDGFLITYARDSATTFLTATSLTRGFDAVRERYAARFEPGAARDSLRFTEVDVRGLCPDWAWATARYVLTRGDSVTATGPFTVILARRPEGWRMVHDHTS
jgi:beta-aspartyl-peptidase (threonine type)